MKWLRSGLFGTAALLGLGALIAIPAQAEPISPAFDGHYQGSGKLLSYMSQGACEKAPNQFNMRIAKGEIRGSAKGGDRINGFVTKNGFFTETCAYLLTMNKM